MKNVLDSTFFNQQFCVGAPQNCHDRSAEIAYAISARGRSKGRSDTEETMRLCSIASGSSGNCIYVGTDTTHVLVDV